MQRGLDGQGRSRRMTILLLVRLGAAVIAILMCSWAMAIAWAAGTQGDADGLVTAPTSCIEMPVECVILTWGREQPGRLFIPQGI